MTVNKVKHYLLNLIHQIRIGQKPDFTFEELDKLGVTFRAQNEVCALSESNKLSGNDIINEIMKKDYLFRYPEGTKTEYIEGYGQVSEELKMFLKL